MLPLALLILAFVGPIAAAAIGSFGAVAGSVVLLAVLAFFAVLASWRIPRSRRREAEWEPIDYLRR